LVELSERQSASKNDVKGKGFFTRPIEGAFSATTADRCPAQLLLSVFLLIAAPPL
jgi:hypothetical protein